MQKALIPVPFAGGIDTKTDPSQVIPGKLLDLQNGVMQKTGAITTRWGYTALGNGVVGSQSSISACAALNEFNNELLLYDGRLAYSYIPAESQWAPRGEVLSVIQTNTNVVRNANQQLSPDHAQLNGVDVYAWEDSRGGIYYQINDAVSGAIVVQNTPIVAGPPFGTINRPKVLACPGTNTVAIFFTDVLGGNFGCAQVNTLAPAQAPVVVCISTNFCVGVSYDACVSSGTGAVYIAHTLTQFAGLANQTTVMRLNPSAGMAIVWVGLPYLQSNIGQLSAYGICVNSSTEQVFIFVGAEFAGAIFGALYGGSGGGGLSLGTRSFPALVASIGLIWNTSTNLLNAYVEVDGASSSGPSYNVVYQFTQQGTGPYGVVGPSVFLRGCGLASKPFQYGGVVYLNIATQTQQQSTYFTVDQNGIVVAKALAALGGGVIASSDMILPECQQISTGIFQYSNLVKGQANTEAGAVFALLGVNATKLNFSQSNQFISSSINGGLYTVGGILQSYDGAQYVEHGFHMYPEAFTLTPSGSGGLLGNGVYYYVVTYEWIDNNGYRQTSTPSIATAVTTTTGTSSVTLTIPTLRLTRKSNVQIVVYRTAVNGTLLTRVTSAAVPLYNSTTVDTVTYTDVLSDASIAGNSALYTQPLSSGGDPVLPNAAPPACTLMTTYANRLWIAGVDDPYTLWYTQPAFIGVPMQFSSYLTLRVDPDGGPITALARMDNNMFIFKRNAIFFISGQGPTNTGDNNDLGTPIQVPSGGVGCISPNSVALTPMGLLFQSATGIYLLDRSLNVTYKGAPVEKFNSLTITSTTVLPNQWVVFTTSTTTTLDGAAIQGLAIVYDYFYDQWSVFTNHAAVDSTIYIGNNSLFVYANPNGTVYLQNLTSYTDNGAPIVLSLTTAWLNPNVLQGYQRIYHAFLLGLYYGTHTLSFAAGFDFDPALSAYAAVASDQALGINLFGSGSPFGADTPFGGSSPGASVYQFRFDLLKKCNAVRFQIVMTPSASPAIGTSQGASFSALCLEVGVSAPNRGNRMALIKQFGVS
jgi:hypothetical protein